MTPIKLTSSDPNESEVLVMFDKITHVEPARTAFGKEHTRIHLGNDSVEVKESYDEVFKLLAIALHKGVSAPELLDSAALNVEADSEPPKKEGRPDLSTEGLMKDSEERYKERNK